MKLLKNENLVGINCWAFLLPRGVGILPFLKTKQSSQLERVCCPGLCICLSQTKVTVLYSNPQCSPNSIACFRWGFVVHIKSKQFLSLTIWFIFNVFIFLGEQLDFETKRNSQKYFKASIERLKKVEENFLIDDLKNTIYDIKPDKVEFKDLIENKYISINDEVSIKETNYKLHFNKDGLILFENELLSPNRICRKVFNKPTNAWDWMTINGVTLSEIREKYRKK